MATINTVNDQPAAVSPLSTDVLLAYQAAQTPKTRKMSVAQVLGVGLPSATTVQLYGGSGSAGAAVAITLAASLALSGTTLGLSTQANGTVLGNVSGGVAAPAALTATQLTALVNAFTSSLSGAVPASGGGTANFLRADGSWASPGGGVTSVSGSGGTTGLTLTGGPTGAVTLTLGGTLVAANGGTGQSSYTAGDMLYASGTTAISKLAAGTSSQVLIGGTTPTWGAVALGGSMVSGILTTAKGGLGIDVSSSGASGNPVLYFSSTGTIAVGPALTGNSIMLGNSTGPKTVSGLRSDGASIIILGGTASANGHVQLLGSTSGTVDITVQTAAGSYNFNLPTSAGTSGDPLLSGGGGATAMTFGKLALTALATQAAGTVLANVTGGSAAPTAATPTSILDLIGSTRGSHLYRGSGGWAALTPGTAGYPLLSAGAGADPAYGQLSLTAAVTGTLPVGNGGTGITNTPYVMLNFPLDGGGLAVTTGYKMYQFVDFAGTVTKWSLFWFDANDQTVSDTGTIDVICDAYSSFGTRTSMVGAGTKPSTSAATKNQAAPSGWTTTSIASGSAMAVNVTVAPATAVRGLLSLTVQRT